MPVNIKGKLYTMVAERVLRAHEGHGQTVSGGFSMLSSEPLALGEYPYWRVVIAVGGCQYIGTAQIKFDAKPGTADGDSPLECAETSALGRALGFAGFGDPTSIASADEMARVATDDPLLPREAEAARPVAHQPIARAMPRPSAPADLAAAIRELANRLDLTDAERGAVFARHKGKKNQLLNVLAELEARYRAEQTGHDPDANSLETTHWPTGA